MNNNIIQSLVQSFSKIPGFGNKSARRAVLYLLKNRENALSSLIPLLENAKTHLKNCIHCDNFSFEDECDICSNKTRQGHLLCIVQDVGDLWALEKSAIFRGYYHILGGVLSAIDGVTPDELNLKKLYYRLETQPISEVILALGSTIEAQTTIHFLVEKLKKYPVKLTIPARGIPIGGELDYMDEGTLYTAFNHRVEV